MKAKIYFLAMAFVALLMVGCSDDDGIQLTQDEIIGDINTGKQVGIKGNSLVIYTTQGARVNVQGAKGKISAQSSDEKVVTVTCIHETGQYGKDERISLSAIAVGKAIVTVTDEDGNEAKLAVEVKDVETLWKTTQVFSGYQKYCKVEGVSKEDSLVIASDAIASKPYEAVKFKSRGDVFTVSRIQFLAGGKMLVDGYYTTTYNEDHSILYFEVGDGNIIFFMIADFKCHSYGIVFIIKGYELRGIFQPPPTAMCKKSCRLSMDRSRFHSDYLIKAPNGFVAYGQIISRYNVVLVVFKGKRMPLSYTPTTII